MTPADLARILAQPDYREANPHLASPTAAQEGSGSVWVYKHATNTPMTQIGCVWRSERDFQRAVVEAFALWTALNGVDAVLCHIANENAHRQSGIVGGMPDLVLISAKGVMFIELKITGGKCSQKQLDIHRRLRGLGYRVVVVWDSVEEVVREIEGYLR